MNKGFAGIPKSIVYRIYNIAISMFTESPRTSEEWDSSTDQNKMFCDIYFEHALYECMTIRDWSFLTRIIDIGEDLGPVGEYAHSYDIRFEDVMKVCRVFFEDERVSSRVGDYSGRIMRSIDEQHYYIIAGDKLLSMAPVDRILGISYSFLLMDDITGIPVNFYNLVGYSLALKLAIPKGQDQRAISLLTSQYANLLAIMSTEDATYGRRDKSDG